ncbi:RDD family protein [Nocardia sp. NBC_01388]|uniref:RDD family protein n=1 Tax=Nocardia sp. NBC_01388 TaxID=2903596 RepID=UPI0032553D17
MTYPNNPYPPQQPQPGYGYPPQQQPGYGYPQQDAGYQQQPGYPQQAPVQPGYPQPAYGAPQPGYNGYSPFGAPQQPLASWGARVGAYFIDTLIFALPGGILNVLAATVGTSSMTCSVDNSSYSYSSSCSGGGYTAVGGILLLLGFVVGVGGMLFLAYREGTTGQTPGKRALNIRLVRESAPGQPLGFGLAFGRKLLHFVDALPCYLGFLWPLWDDKNQTFADKIVGTVVVKA